MNMTQFHTEKEIATAWGLYNSLHEHAEALWERYEKQFVGIIMAKSRIERMPLPPENEIDVHFDEDDIPY